MLKILQIGIGTAVAFLVAASGENLVTAAMIGLLASLAVARVALWRYRLEWDATQRAYSFVAPSSSAPGGRESANNAPDHRRRLALTP